MTHNFLYILAGTHLHHDACSFISAYLDMDALMAKYPEQ